METCEVLDTNNWICTDYLLDFEVKNGLLTLLKKDPYKGESKYEVCQVKDWVLYCQLQARGFDLCDASIQSVPILTTVYFFMKKISKMYEKMS